VLAAAALDVSQEVAAKPKIVVRATKTLISHKSALAAWMADEDDDSPQVEAAQFKVLRRNIELARIKLRSVKLSVRVQKAIARVSATRTKAARKAARKALLKLVKKSEAAQRSVARARASVKRAKKVHCAWCCNSLITCVDLCLRCLWGS
jgi:hypothetical protein